MHHEKDDEVRMFGAPTSSSKLISLSEVDMVELGRKLGFVRYPLDHFANWFNHLTNNGQSSPERILARLDELVIGIGNHLTSDEIKSFFGEPHPDLYNDRPIDVLNTEVGYYAVRRILTNLILTKHS